MIRVMLFDRFDQPLGELSPDEVLGLVRKETVNGEHALEITTARVLEQGWRVLTQDARGVWREHVVYAVDALHEARERAKGTYYCTWSVQPDLMGTRVSHMPGVQEPVAASTALAAALSGTSRWQVGTVTQVKTAGASMYDTDGWDAISTLLENWGGELSTTIEVGLGGVTARKVDLYAQQGEQEARRRFDFGADLKSVRRKVADGPLYCRITPRGKGEQTEAGGYGRKITIESVNDGKDYLENADMVDLAKLPDGNGGWEYPTVEVENSSCETPTELLAWAQGVLEASTLPQVTYDVDVLQAAREGVDMQGVSLGDAVQIVDRRFGEGLRLAGRVTSMTVNMLDEAQTVLSIGSVSQGIGGVARSLSKRIDAVNSMAFGSAVYLDNILDNLNAVINATGGYTYITEGYGLRTYDRAVSDPLVGAEADAVVEIKGGTIRIANSRTAQGDWEWKTVFTSGKIVADFIRGGTLQVGGAGNANGVFQVLDANGNVISVLDNSGANITGVVRLELPYNVETKETTSKENQIITENNYVTTADSASFWNLTGATAATVPRYVPGLKVSNITSYTEERSYVMIVPFGKTYSSSSSYWWNSIVSKNPLIIWGSFEDPSGRSFIRLLPHSVELRIGDSATIGSGNTLPGISINETRILLNSYGTTWSNDLKIESGTITMGGPITVTGAFSVRGTKSRQAETDHYGDRLLYSYETPAPMFGDVGSGTLDGDGLCYVEVDDVFSETARTDFAYQVFLQKCGAGDLWVAEKHPTHFVVEGTPGLAFDWEIKARQAGFENIRMEDGSYDSTGHSWVVEADELEGLHGDYVQEIEQLQLQGI